jgi:phenylpyruvate tautomerase PptA (4-oxalocrotonate tautomerase family)
MPLIRISLREGKPAEYRSAIAEGVYGALRETFNVPEGDFFAIVTEHKPEDLLYDRQYFNIDRSDDFVVIQLTVSNTRTLEQKKALYRGMVDRLRSKPGPSATGRPSMSSGITGSVGHAARSLKGMGVWGLKAPAGSGLPSRLRDGDPCQGQSLRRGVGRRAQGW